MKRLLALLVLPLLLAACGSPAPQPDCVKEPIQNACRPD